MTDVIEYTWITTKELDELDTLAREYHPKAAVLLIGGAHAVAAVVEEFYTRLLADPLCAPYFEKLLATDNLSGLKRHQVHMLVTALGGGSQYDTSQLRGKHAEVRTAEGVPITAPIYRRVSLHLLLVLHDFKVVFDVIDAVAEALYGLSAVIVPDPDKSEASA